MEKTNHGATRFGHCMIFLIVFAHVLLNNEFVEATNRESVKHKGTIKTIESEDGEVIDCVDIYKQPAFDHPLLKNHTIEMEPTFYPTQTDTQMTQSLLKHVECPQYTIPIRRGHNFDYRHHAASRTIPQKSSDPNLGYSAHEYAQVSEHGGVYLGAQARINIWNPKTEDNELSVSQIWLVSSDGVNTIEAGWTVLPFHYDNATRFFVYWTSDNYDATGCFNLDCPGFVQTSRSSILGGVLSPISTLNSAQYDILVSIYKNTTTGNWWLMVDNQVIGYWPDSIFTETIVGGASLVTWGGEVINSKSKGHHTSTQMGSGHFPNEGYGKSSYFHNLKYINEHGITVDAGNLKPFISNPSCYDLSIDKNNKAEFGTHFYYGGPGYSDKCRDGGASSSTDGGTRSSVVGKISVNVFLIISALIVVCTFF